MVPDLATPKVKTGRSDLRRRNKRLLLHLVQTDGPSSQAELARRSGLSPAAVSAILQPLIENQILIEERRAGSGLGRKASILAFNPRAALAAGIAIEQEECEIALVDLSARVLDRASVTYPRYTEPHEIVAAAASRVFALLEKNQISPSVLVGTGVAVPGLIDSSTGLVYAASNLGWHNVQLRSLFEQKLQLPARVEHLGRAKVRAESIWGQGKQHENFVCLEIGSGIGAGVMAEGRILRGATGSAGEVGHTPLDPSGPRCACGLNGCWEVYCSSPAMRRRLSELLASSGVSGSMLSPAASLTEIGRAAHEGDPVARQVVDETAGHLARGLVGVIWNFDPELVILSGPVVRDCPGLIDATRSVLGALEAARKFDIPIVAAAQEVNAGVIAASAIISVQHLEALASE
jgi:N-acetylglucosamine repressor